jgi:hypothetical protein
MDTKANGPLSPDLALLVPNLARKDNANDWVILHLTRTLETPSYGILTHVCISVPNPVLTAGEWHLSGQIHLQQEQKGCRDARGALSRRGDRVHES